MARNNLRPKSDLNYWKLANPAQPKRVEKPNAKDNKKSMTSETEALNNVIKELQGKLERSEEECTKKDRMCRALEDELATVLAEMINTKKENDSLMAQMKMQKCVNECEPLPLLVNEKFPIDIAMAKQDANDEGFVLPDKKPHECVPVSEENFETWDKSLENKESFALMKASYLEINLKKIKQFVKACILKTFSKDLIPKIHFESGNSFNDSNILSCLIESVQEKFEKNNLDNQEARKEIIAAFRRYRDAENRQK